MAKKNKKNKIKIIPPCDCLESLMKEFINDGKKQPLFLKKVKCDKEGHKQPFTKAGAECYGELVEVLYDLSKVFPNLVSLDNFCKSIHTILGKLCIGNLCDISAMSFEEIVEEMDDICNQDF